MKYYEIEITRSRKQMGSSKEKYQFVDEERFEFDSLGEVREWLILTYGKYEGSEMFRDEPDTEQVGWIYYFNKGKWRYKEQVRVNYVRLRPILVW